MLYPGEELAIQAARGGELAWIMWWPAVLAAVGPKESGVEHHQGSTSWSGSRHDIEGVMVSKGMDIGQGTADPAVIASTLLDFSRQNEMPLGMRLHCAVLLFGVGGCASGVVQKTDLFQCPGA